MAHCAIQCGLVPREITLNRGGRQKLVFWTDQTFHDEEDIAEVEIETTTKDYLLEVVNGGVGKQDDTEELVNDDDKTTMSPQDEAFLVQDNELDFELFGNLNENIVMTDTTTETDEDFVESTTTKADNEDDNEAGSTTINPMLDEIYDDDSEVEFEEDFGTPINSQPEVVYDPLDDIVDIPVSAVTALPIDNDNVELFETAEFTTVATYNNVDGQQQRLFDKTTIAYPIGEDKDDTIRFPILEAVEAESEENDDRKPIVDLFEKPVVEAEEEKVESERDENGDFIKTTTASNDLKQEDQKPVFEAVVAEEDEEADDVRPPLVDSQGNFIETTTPSEKPLSSIGIDDGIVESFEIQAVVAEEEEEEERPNTLLDEEGNYIQTTTGNPKDSNAFKLEASLAEIENEDLKDPEGNLIETTTGSSSVTLNKVAKVAALEKLPRGAVDSDISTDSLQQIEVPISESPLDVVPNITDPSDRPGSILTTLIDGFLLQKQPIVEEVEKTASIDKEQETAGGFPVTNILSGIYSLVSSYIQPTEKVTEEEPITAIPQSAINVHNMPRDQLIVEAIEDFQAPPLPILPPEYLRARPIDIEPKPKPVVPESLSGPVLVLTENAKGGKPVSIPVPVDYETDVDKTKEIEEVLDPRAFDPVESVRSSDKQHFKQWVVLHLMPKEKWLFFS